MVPNLLGGGQSINSALIIKVMAKNYLKRQISFLIDKVFFGITTEYKELLPSARYPFAQRDLCINYWSI
jgi:hypothetical protein